MRYPFVAFIVACVVFLGAGEFASFWWLERYGNALDQTRSILETDAEIGWKQRPDLTTTFLDLPLSTNEWGWRDAPIGDAAAPSVLVLGPSSAFGWGVRQEETYAAELQSLLENRMRVYNAGEIGYSSEQGVHLFSQPEVQALEPDIVVIAYGVNDLDRHRFYFQSSRTDKEEFREAKSEWSVRTVDFIHSDAFLHLLLKSAGALGATISSPETRGSVRVSIEEFKKNIGAMIDMAQRQGSSVIVLTTATNVEAALSSETDAVKRSEISRIINEIPKYNAALLKIAAEKKVHIGTIEQWFEGKERTSLFVDPIHFSPEGNRIIAEELYDIIKRTQ